MLYSYIFCFTVIPQRSLNMLSATNTLSYILAQSEPSSGGKGKAIYNKNLSN